jgi:hypothetical protein
MIIDGKEHLTEQGLRRIVALKAGINLGLSNKLKEAFLHIVPVKRYSVTESLWSASFTHKNI